MWLPIPDLDALPGVPVVAVPRLEGEGLAAAPPEAETAIWTSPARQVAPDPEVWLSIPDVTSLPDAIREHPADSRRSHHHVRPTGRPARPTNRRSVDPHLTGGVTVRAHRAGELLPTLPVAPPELVPPAERLEPLAQPLPQGGDARATPRRSLFSPARRTAIGALVALTCVVAVVLAFTNLLGGSGTTVEIRVDGDTISKKTDARTVRALLREAGVQIDSDDRVEPALGTEVRDGLIVRVTRNITLLVDVDGRTRSVTTSVRTVDELRRELGIPADSVLVEGTEQLSDGGRVVLRDPRLVTLTVDGTTTVVNVPVATVRELLAVQRITLDGDDRVEPGLDVAVTEGTGVRVVRVVHDTVTIVEPLPYAEERRDDPNLPKGQTEVLREGTQGTRAITYARVLEDGVVKAQAPTGPPAPGAAPVNRVVAVGTKVTPPSPANSESGQATHYATGPGPGFCAHKTLPFGTLVKVTDAGAGASTFCVVQDRGPYGGSRVIDLHPAQFSALAPLGDGVISVVLSW